MLLTEYNEAETMQMFKEEYLVQGRKEGRKEGRAEGRAEGRKEGRAESLQKLAVYFLKEGKASTEEEALKMAEAIFK